MTEGAAGTTQRWSSRLAFVLAAAGAAIGLGNLWRFPFLAGENGGGAFVLVYLAAVAVVGFPIMVGELMIGRHGRGNAERAVDCVTAEAGASRGWHAIGLLSVFIPFVGIGYYSVVAGWVVDYLLVYLTPGGPGFASGADAAAHFDSMLASPERLFLLHLAFMAGIALVVARGVRAGIERVAKLMMPGLFVLLAGLVLFAAWKGDFVRGVEFMFAPDFAAFGWKGVLAALGQAFFSLAVGIGALMTFGAYLDEKTSLPRVAAQICLADTAVALLAGLAIFPIVFAYGLETNGGEGLVFVALPTAFAAMPAGQLVGAAFFLLVFFAAFTTGVATLEPVVAWLVDRGMTRPR
ncbi:MAG: sodium-dependent transporter, partial [Rhodothalassiaceae bacterium]